MLSWLHIQHQLYNSLLAEFYLRNSAPKNKKIWSHIQSGVQTTPTACLLMVHKLVSPSWHGSGCDQRQLHVRADSSWVWMLWSLPLSANLKIIWLLLTCFTTFEAWILIEAQAHVHATATDAAVYTQRHLACSLTGETCWPQPLMTELPCACRLSINHVWK